MKKFQVRPVLFYTEHLCICRKTCSVKTNSGVRSTLKMGGGAGFSIPRMEFDYWCRRMTHFPQGQTKVLISPEGPAKRGHGPPGPPWCMPLKTINIQYMKGSLLLFLICVCYHDKMTQYYWHIFLAISDTLKPSKIS